MFADDIDRLMRSFQLVLINNQVATLPQNWTADDWARWVSNKANVIICKTYFLQGAIEVSTVFIPQNNFSGRQFETTIFSRIEGRYDDYPEFRWEACHEAWLAHWLIATIVDRDIPKLRAAIAQ